MHVFSLLKMLQGHKKKGGGLYMTMFFSFYLFGIISDWLLKEQAYPEHLKTSQTEDSNTVSTIPTHCSASAGSFISEREGSVSPTYKQKCMKKGIKEGFL